MNFTVTVGTEQNAFLKFLLEFRQWFHVRLITDGKRLCRFIRMVKH